jgi:hypothetical protein
VVGYFIKPVNITLPASTATTGNIMKGANRFIHNFGAENTFIGEYAGNFTMTGYSNTASGYQALISNTTGASNTASGVNALVGNTTGGANTASGHQALYSNTIGTYNTASGYGALLGNTTGGGNTAYGANVLNSNTTGIYNTASGVSALYYNTTGNYNIAIGLNAGSSLTTGSSNIDIGNLGVATEGNTIRIGDSNQTRAFIAGIYGAAALTNGTTVYVDSTGRLGTNPSSRRYKDNIADMDEASTALMKLRPVTFHYKSDRNPAGRSLQYGLIAEEVAEVYPGLVAHSADGKIETVMYQYLPAMLLNEYQKQQRIIEVQAESAKLQAERIAVLAQERQIQAVSLFKQAERIAILEKETARIATLEQQVTKVVALEQLTTKMAATLDQLQRDGMLTAGLQLK